MDMLHPIGHPDHFRSHDLRHTCSSLLAANNAKLVQIGHVLGHRSAVSTNRYTHLCNAAKKALTDDTMSGLSIGSKYLGQEKAGANPADINIFERGILA